MILVVIRKFQSMGESSQFFKFGHSGNFSIPVTIGGVLINKAL